MKKSVLLLLMLSGMAFANQNLTKVTLKINSVTTYASDMTVIEFDNVLDGACKNLTTGIIPKTYNTSGQYISLALTAKALDQVVEIGFTEGDCNVLYNSDSSDTASQIYSMSIKSTEGSVENN